MNKIINSQCICNNKLNYKDLEYIILLPCEHILHYECYNHKNCPLCSEKIETFITEKKINRIKDSNKENYQRYVDLISMKNYESYSKVNYNNLFKVFGGLPELFIKLPFTKGFDNGYKLCSLALNLLNLNIKVYGHENLDLKKNQIFIANHTSHYDFIILFYLLKCSFLASTVIKKSYLGNLVSSIVPLVFINRNMDTNTVERMRSYIEKNNRSICLFPEGMISHPDTIIQFRSGAFHVGYPITPIVLKYEPVVYSSDAVDFMNKLLSNDITISVYILKEELPPFSNEKIEQVRNKMAEVGNFGLSRVSNRDIKDK